MKKEIYKLLSRLFFVFVLISTLIFYTELRLREIPNSYTVKRYYFEMNLDSLVVLILGSSHELEGINPVYLKMKGYNLSNGAQSLYYDKELILKYIYRMPKLKIVLVSISYFSLWYELYNFPESWREDSYYNFWGIRSNNSKFFDLKRICYIDLYGTSFAQNAFRKNFKVTSDFYPDKNGWYFKKLDYPFYPTDSLGKDRIRFHNTMMQDNVLENNVGYLETMLSEITKRKIIPVFITTPVHKTYYDNVDPEKIKVIEEEINKLCLKFHCKYFNYIKDPRFYDDDFDDEDHLNPKGAEKFTKILNDEILLKFITLSK